MSQPSTEYPVSRPFKIFISLLDKWEIGGPLTEAMVLDVFRAVKNHMQMKESAAEDVSPSVVPVAVINRAISLSLDPFDRKLAI
jgi:hypothetical protein